MKTIKLFGLLLMATLVFAACSKDDDEDPVNVSGTKWEVTYVKAEVMGQKAEYETAESIEGSGYYAIIEFKADKKVYRDGIESGTWAQAGDKVTVTDSDGDEIAALTVSGSTLVQNEGVEGFYSIEAHYTQIK